LGGVLVELLALRTLADVTHDSFLCCTASELALFLSQWSNLGDHCFLLLFLI
jgi:hypothetical protein